MRIHIRGYLTFREVVGDRKLEIPTERVYTLRKLLETLAEEIGEENSAQLFEEHTGNVRQNVALLVNGRSVVNLPDQLETILEDGDEVAIFPPIMGGCSTAPCYCEFLKYVINTQAMRANPFAVDSYKNH